MLKSFNGIIEAAKEGGAKRLVIPAATKMDMKLLGKAAGAGLVIPLLVGDGKVIEDMIEETALKSLKYEIVDEKDPDKVLSTSIQSIREGRADILMQGSVNHQALMDAVMDAKNGLRKGKLMSFISVFQLLKPEKLILVTDTFINNSPTLADKQLILEHALKLAGILGIDTPKVAALAAIEQINLNIPSTLDAAILSKMSERKQFGKAIVEGPLDIDCALSEAAAARKGLKSIVTGNVDIYLVPEVDTGHLLAEALVFFGKMETAGAIMGTTNPVILNLPFVADEGRIVEIAIASLMCGKGGDGA
ncbi:MAG TPA: phosphate butyryltransferase [Deltaproteobacteria bacterium]|nr:phosphate butyryltransferase [Deltaproteobacteria bacterium]